MPAGRRWPTVTTESRNGPAFRRRSYSTRPLVVVLVVLGLLVAGMPPVAPERAKASHANIKMPFAAGVDWYVSQGYNTSPAEGWSHYNCDARTGRDEISGSERCDAGWQYKYSFDLRRSDGQEAGQPVLSPVDGMIRWIDPYHGGMSIDLGDGYAVAFYHADLVRGVAEGQAVRQGQKLGTVAGPGGGANGGTPHIHLTLWQTDDGGNWSRNAVPFTDQHALDGYDFPALGERVRNQHFNAVVASTNRGGQNEPEPPVSEPTPTTETPPDATTQPDRPRRPGRGGGRETTPEATSEAAATPPTTPMPSSPASGTSFAADQAPVLSWEAVSVALEYQVVLNEGERTGPWLADTSWSAGTLPAGEYRWQVRARNWAGESALWEPWTFTVAAADDVPVSAATPAPGLPVDSGLEPPVAPTVAPQPTEASDVVEPTVLSAANEGTPTANEVAGMPTTMPPVNEVATSPPPAETPPMATATVPQSEIASETTTPEPGAAPDPTAPPEPSEPTVAADAVPAEPTVASDGAMEGDELSPREQAAAVAAYDTANELRERHGLEPMEIPVAIAAAPVAETESAANEAPVIGATQDVASGEGNAEGGVGGPSSGVAPGDAEPTDVAAETAVAGTEAVLAPATESPPVVDDQSGADGVARTGNEPETRRGRRAATATADPVTGEPAQAEGESAAVDAAPGDVVPGEMDAIPAAEQVDEFAASEFADATSIAEGAEPPTATALATVAPAETLTSDSASAEVTAAPIGDVVVAAPPEPTPVPPPLADPTLGNAADQDSLIDPALDPSVAVDPMLAPAPPLEPTLDPALVVDPALAVDPAGVGDPALAVDPPVAGDPALDVDPAVSSDVVPVTDPAAAEPDVAVEPQRLVLVPAADTAVMAIAPEAVQAPEQVAMLPTGGSVGAVAYLTFQVAGVPTGGVLDARLILTGVGDVAGAGGVLGVLPGAWVDEGASFATAPPAGAPALTASGAVATVDWLQPGIETAVDVSGSVTADGLVTFVIVGSPEALAAVASRESATPPRLELTVAPVATSQDHFSG